jgi:dimeric dUTPase (all-alpha-NTP-PPase superfamily)
MSDFSRMMSRQLELQRDSFGLDPLAMEGEELAEFVRWNVLALEDELHEALDEVRWKPWASDTGFIDRDAFVKELVDAMHFLMNLMLVANASPEEIYNRYFAKAGVNQARQEAGYTHGYMKGADGRALDEPEVQQ